LHLKLEPKKWSTSILFCNLSLYLQFVKVLDFKS
jgi:hypothetical protein